MTKEEAIKEINDTQDEYIDKLVGIINKTNKLGEAYKDLKEINFTSPTGTGKTVMMSKLINRLKDYFFVVTTLSRGQLRVQVEQSLKRHCEANNFIVFGLNEYTKNTILQKEDYEKMLPKDKDIIWLRDEGHIQTCRWQELLSDRSSLIVNFSATNKNKNGIECNFTHTMMLRTVVQQAGTPEDALDKLIEVKKLHKDVKNYNPCALFRVIDDEFTNDIIDLCEEYKLKYINITNEDYDMNDICKDDNEYDVIINKFKITEGIDLKRCHVIYMDNKPGNDATVVQVIGRARRNALLWRDDIDILKEENEDILDATRKCYIFYNVPETKLQENDEGELSYTLCDTISVEQLKANTTIFVKNGRLMNGLKVIELKDKTGEFHITFDETYKCNVVDNDDFYQKELVKKNNLCVDLSYFNLNLKKIYFKPSFINYIKSEGNLSSLEIDPLKKDYLYLEYYLVKKNISIDFNKLRYTFAIGDEYFKLPISYENKLLKIIEELPDKIKPQVNDYFVSRKYNPSYSRFKPKAALVYKHNFLEEDIDYKVEILLSAANGTYAFRAGVLKHIEAMDIIERSYYDKLTSVIEDKPNVYMLEFNKFLYAKHPLCEKLRSRGITSLPTLKRKLIGSKVNYLGTPVSYYQTMLKKIHSFDEIDEYETKIIDLKKISTIFRLKIPKEVIEAYINKTVPHVKIEDLQDNGVFKMEISLKDIKSHKYNNIAVNACDFIDHYKDYQKVFNDKEIGIVGPDIMKFSNNTYIEDRPVTSKIKKFCKLNTFIARKYEKQISLVEPFLFRGENNFDFNKRCNSCLGYCVEYYAKYLLFGNGFNASSLIKAQDEAHSNDITDPIIVRACMIMYREDMKRCYGYSISNLIKSISIENLIDEAYESFVDTVVTLGKRTAEFVEDIMHIKEDLGQGLPLYDPNLSVNHISALADFINEDTIIDIKCTSSIDVNHVKQVLAYHYLSTKRSDLHIRHLYVYDAVTNRYVYIPIEE